MSDECTLVNPALDISLRTNHIVEVAFNVNEISLELTKALFEKKHEYIGETNYAMLIDLRGGKKIDVAARRYHIRVNCGCLAKAILVDSFLQETLIQSYLLARRTDYPISIFREEDLAIDWLKSEIKGRLTEEKELSYFSFF